MRPSLRWLAPALALCLAPVASSQDGPTATLEKLQKDYADAVSAFFEPLESAKTDEERANVRIDWASHPASEHLYLFQDFADENEGEDAAAHALLKVMELAGQANAPQQAKYAVVDLTDTYIESEVMADVASMLARMGSGPGGAFYKNALNTILDESPHKNAKAAALMSLGQMSSDMGKADEAKAFFVRLSEEYADTPAAASAKPFIFEIERLQLGMVAPDVDAVDGAGVNFKLSDYRGKVTVVDFWGFW